MSLNFKNKKVLVMGLGLHGGGVAVARWLAKKGAKVTVTDLKSKRDLRPSLEKLKGLPIKYVLGAHKEEDFRNQDIIIQNPGVSNDSPFLKIARKNKIKIYNEASLFLELVKTDKVIGITGTRGKSTTTFLIYEMLKNKYPNALLGGNIRIKTMFDIVDKVKDNYVVLELSSWHLEGLERIKKSPHGAILTNIMPDHLNRYRNFEEYIKAKTNIFLYQKKSDFLVLNYDNKITRKLSKRAVARLYFFSKKFFPEENGAFLKDDWLVFRAWGKEEKVLPIHKIALKGEHNLENVLAAVTTGMVLGVGKRNIRRAVYGFSGLWGRIQLVGEKRGIRYYNDTTATTPEATLAALKALGEAKRVNIILIAGGSDKGLEFSNLAQVVKRYCKKVVLFEGEASKKIEKELTEVGFEDIEKRVFSMREAVKRAQNFAQKGDIILLSPAAASFGLFQNEFDRGEQFVENVERIA